MPVGGAGGGPAAAKVLKFQHSGTVMPSDTIECGNSSVDAWAKTMDFDNAGGTAGSTSSFFDQRIQDLLFPDGDRNPTRKVDLAISCVIILNAIVIVLEVDLGPRDPYTPVQDRMFWFLAESMFTVIYVMELVFRIHQQHLQWVRSWWNWLDAIVVVVSVVDCFILTLLLEADLKALRLLTFLRMVRLMRLVRIIRLLRMCRGLYIMVMAFWNAMTSLCWIVVLMVLGLLISATFATVTIGHNESFRHVMVHGESVCDRFGTVPKSMYALFELMTLEDWHEVGRPLVAESPMFFIFIFAFIIVFTFGLLNMIVGMVVERTLVFARKQDNTEQEMMKKRLAEDLGRMREIFLEADDTGSGQIELSTFRAALERNNAIVEILKGLDIPTSDALELFMTLDAEGQGRLTVQKFLEGIAKLRGAISQRWDEMATHAGVRLLLRKAIYEAGEETFLETSRGQTPSTTAVAAARPRHPSLVEVDTEVPGTSSATSDTLKEVCRSSCGQRSHTLRDDGARILELLEAQAEAQARRHLEVEGRLRSVEDMVSKLRQLRPPE